MAQIKKNNFTSGELTNYLRNRNDLQQYQNAVANLTNFDILPYGGITKRKGFKHEKVLGSSQLKTFKVFNRIGEFYIEFLRNGNNAEISIYNGGFGVSDFINTPIVSNCFHSATTSLNDVRIIQTETEVVFVHPLMEPIRAYIPVGAVNWNAEIYPLVLTADINEDSTHTLSVSGGGSYTLSSNKAVFSSNDLRRWYVLRHIVTQTENNFALSGNFTQTFSNRGGTVDIVTTGIWAGSLTLQVQNKNTGAWETVLIANANRDRNIIVDYVITPDTTTEQFNCRLVYAHMSSEVDSNVYLRFNEYKIEGAFQAVTYVSPTSMVVTLASSFTLGVGYGATNDFNYGATRFGANPSYIAFHEQRLVVTGVEDEPQTVWMSATGVLNNFKLGVVDTDALKFTIFNSHGAIIRSVTSLSNVLLLGTSNGLYSVLGSGAGTKAISPSSFTVTHNDSVPISAVDPIIANGKVLCVNETRNKLYLYDYSYQTEKYESLELSILFEHLFSSGYKVNGAKDKIAKLIYKQDIANKLFVLHDSGTISVVMLDIKQDIVGASKYDFFLPITNFIEFDDELLVTTSVSGVQSLLSFVDDYPKLLNGVREIYLDSYYSYSGVATDTLINCDSLVGQTNLFVIDTTTGIFYPVVMNGTSATFTPFLTDFVVGKQYTAEFTTFPLDFTSEDDRTKKYDSARKVYADMYLTPSLNVYVDTDIAKKTTLVNSSNILTAFTGMKEVYTGADLKKETTITLLSEQPTSATILNISVNYRGVQNS